MKIKITNEPAEQIAYAKAIVMQKKDTYTDMKLKDLRDVVKRYMRSADAAAVEETLLRTIYYYWAYGCTVKEYFYYKLFDKPHDEIKKYILLHDRVIYGNLNRNKHFKNKWEVYQTFREYFRRDAILLQSDADYPRFCEFIDKHPVFVVKPIDTYFGRGVHKITIEKNITEKKKLKIFSSILDEIRENNENCLSKETAIMLEELIIGASEIEKFHPDSVQVVTIYTIRTRDKIHVYYPFFKCGRGGNSLMVLKRVKLLPVLM